MIAAVKTDLSVRNFLPLFCEVFGADYASAERELLSIWDEIIPFAIEKNGVAVSELLAFPLSHNGTRALYLYAIATDAEMRGKGYMSALLENVEEWAADNGYSYTLLIPASERLAQSYARLGYAEKIIITAGAYPDTPGKISASADIPLYDFDGDFSRLCKDCALMPRSLEYAINSYPASRLYLTDGGWVLTNESNSKKILAACGINHKISTSGAHYALAKSLDGSKIPDKIYYPLPR